MSGNNRTFFSYFSSREEFSIKDEFLSRLIYPNPLDPTGIEFKLPAEARVTLVMFDTEGRELGKLIDGQVLSAGTHAVDFLARGYTRGVYLCRLFIDNGGETLIDTKRIVLGSRSGNIKP